MNGRMPAPGEDLGPYHVTRVIGRGGMGVVFGAVHRGLEREIALKVLPAEMADEVEYRARFLSEARTLARLDSPHVVTIHDAGEIDGCLYLAMQLVASGDLSAWIRVHGPLDLPTALDLLLQIADGLAAAHDAGVLHRDIKTSNVLLREGRRLHAYLCDFGIAQAGDTQHTRTGAVVGTWAYLAPERHDGTPATTATDVYALGCLLWVMVTGRAPYEGSTEWQVAVAHRTEPIPQLVGNDPQSAAVSALLRDLLAKRPEERLDSAAEVVARVAGIVGIAARSDADAATPGPTAESGERVTDSTAAFSADVPTAHSIGPDSFATATVAGGASGAGDTDATVRSSSAATAAHPAVPLDSPRSGSSRRRRGVLLGVVALVLVVGVGITLALLRERPETANDERVEDPTYASVAPGAYGDLVVQHGSEPIEYAGEAWALENGYFVEAGFGAVDPRQPPAEVAELLTSGEVDIGFISTLAASVAFGEGAPITLIATTFQTSPIAVLSLSDGADIRTPADLVGKRIGVQDGNLALFRHLLDVNGIDQQQLETVSATPDDAQPLIDGDLDAIVGFTTDQVPAFRAAGLEVSVMTYASAGVPFPTLAVAVTDDYLAENRDAVQAYLTAMIRGWRDVLEAPAAETVAVVEEQFDDSSGKAAGDPGPSDEDALAAVRELLLPPGSGGGLLTTSAEQQEQVVTAASVLGYDVAAADLFDTSVLADVYTAHPELLDDQR